MLVLHIANKLYSSWSLRPWLLMKELGISFTEVLHHFEAGPSQAHFRAFSPTGKVPCLHAQELVIWDSLAIVEYLADQGYPVWPGDCAARAWARCACAEMHAGYQALRQHCSMRCGIQIQLHTLADAVQDDIQRIEELWTQGLQQFGGPFLAGAHFGAVDAFFAPVVLRFQIYKIDLHEASSSYAQRILALPHLQAWIAAALTEPKQPDHEQWALQAGHVLQDLHP